jgi:hypothetical protein
VPADLERQHIRELILVERDDAGGLITLGRLRVCRLTSRIGK